MSMLNHHSSSHPGHQRGQSTASILSGSSGNGNGNSVCPQDLILRRESGSERNKRKRAIWDGANVSISRQEGSNLLVVERMR